MNALKKYRNVVSVVGCFFSSLAFAHSIDDYSLVIRLNDQDKELFSIVSCADYKNEQEYQLNPHEGCYTVQLWPEIVSLWEDLNRPELIGCSQAHVTKDADDQLLFVFSSTLFIETVFCRTSSSSEISVIDAWFIPNVLLKECNRERYSCFHDKKNYLGDYQALLSDEDEYQCMQELEQQSEPSLFSHYAQKTGVALFLRYLALKEGLKASFSYIRGLFKSIA
jgi:L-rhamnose mutarotase